MAEPTVLTTHEQLVDLLGEPVARVARKVRPELHTLDRAWIAAAPLVLLATSDAAGRCDVSPKGDPPGSFAAPDARTVVLPERPGNRRADGYHNILDNPHVGMVFLLPGRGDTLRVNGRARLLTDPPYAEEFVVRGHRPVLFLEVEVEEVFHHCAKAFLRSGAWQPETWAPDAVPGRPEIARALERPEDDLATLAEYYGPEYAERLYVETAPLR